MADFTFSLDDDQIRIWERFAELRGCSFEHLVRVMVPSITDQFLVHLVNPEIADRIEEEGLAVLPEEMQEILLWQRRRLMGDYQAIQKGKVGRRIRRRLAGEATGRALGKLFKY
jgi:hypothetical protein